MALNILTSEYNNHHFHTTFADNYLCLKAYHSNSLRKSFQWNEHWLRLVRVAEDDFQEAYILLFRSAHALWYLSDLRTSKAISNAAERSVNYIINLRHDNNWAIHINRLRSLRNGDILQTMLTNASSWKQTVSILIIYLAFWRFKLCDLDYDMFSYNTWKMSIYESLFISPAAALLQQGLISWCKFCLSPFCWITLAWLY